MQSNEGLVQQLQSQLINLQANFHSEKHSLYVQYEGHLLAARQSCKAMKSQRDDALSRCAEMQNLFAQVSMHSYVHVAGMHPC